MLRPAIENSSLREADVQERRGQIEARLSQFLAGYPLPLSYQLMLDGETQNQELIA